MQLPELGYVQSGALRSEGVRDYLVNQANVDEGRLKAVGFGEERPFKPHNSGRENNKLNRRSEFLVY